MKKIFEKDGKVRSFEVNNDRVMATLQIGGGWVANPTLEAFLSDGWREYIAPVPKSYIPTYAELVEQYIREHGYETYGAELAVINNYAQDPTTYAKEFAAYIQTRADAKNWAENQQHRNE